MTAPRVVAFGGGHGLAATLRALTAVTPHVTAVVTVADDGGSSGRLRRELGVLPPGDLRMALAALAADAQWEALLQHRYAGDGELGGHAAGNLLLLAFADLLGGFGPALAHVGRVVGARGRVLPLSETPLDICASVAGLGAEPVEVRGQVAVATTPGRVRHVRLEPEDPPAGAGVVDAVLEADWLVLGPGSWYTSVLPHLLVPDVAAAVAATGARRLLVLNLSAQPGETAGMTPEDHLRALHEHAPSLRADLVLADPGAVGDRDRLDAAAAVLGAEVVTAPVAVADGRPAHDPALLAAAYRALLTTRDGTTPDGTTPPGTDHPATTGEPPAWR